MWWQDSRGIKYYKRKSREESFCPQFNKRKFLNEVRQASRLSDYHKKQLVRAVHKGLGDYIMPTWKEFQSKKISAQDLILDVNKTLVEKELRDDQIYFTSVDDFFSKF